jgi:RNA polymerase sigma-70 factor, ECF subfamily
MEMPARPSYAVIEDRYLVAAALAGKPDAYDELVRRYRGAVILLAMRSLGSREAAQDVAQEAFIIGFQQLPQLKDPRRFGPWIRTIAHNRAKRLGKLESRSLPVEDGRMDLVRADNLDPTCNPVEAVLKKERDTAIRGLVASLPPGTQMALQLYYAEQWSVTQIAEFLSLTKTTVKWRLHAGRKQLARALAEAIDRDAPTGATGVSLTFDPTEENTDGKEQEAGDQADPARAGRDRIPCRR